MFDRIVSAGVGAVAGAVVYFGFDLLSQRHGMGSGHWSLTGNVRWFALVGAILGFFGGRDIAGYLWDRAVGSVRDDANSTIFLALFILLFIGIVVAGLYLSR
jgi:hypothetical protein